MMLYNILFYMALGVVYLEAVHFPSSPNSDVSADEKSATNNDQNKTVVLPSDENVSSAEIEIDNEELKEKKFLDDALEQVLDPNTVFIKDEDIVENYKLKLQEIEKSNVTVNTFFNQMNNLSLQICKDSQKALWTYVNNARNKELLIQISREEDEIKKKYWSILKQKYLNDSSLSNELSKNSTLMRKIRLIKEKSYNIQMPQTKQREEIDDMQRIWSRATVCAYNVSNCNDGSAKTLGDLIYIFKTSNDTKELTYYWKAYRDVTGRQVRPIFKDYVTRMNSAAQTENFTDAGAMWRYMYEDENFIDTVERLWTEIKPLYNELHTYVRLKLKKFYKDALNLSDDNNIPAHVLGNLWAQDWQALYPKLVPYPQQIRATLNKNDAIDAKSLFQIVDDFYISLGFETSNDSYQNIKESVTGGNCLPSSHDLCDGSHYRINWCGSKITDISVELLRAARLLGHVEYFKSYSHLPLIYRDGPTPAFHEALSEIIAMQVVAPKHLTTSNVLHTLSVDASVSSEATINHLLWMALEKLPLMAYGYTLDKWRWDVFSNTSIENLNQHWWDLRTTETRITPPVFRNESDLDPASKYHVVSHVQYITYLISHIIEFQVLFSMCMAANHTGPLHECNLYGSVKAGNILRDGMSMGSKEDWRSVLKLMTGETELSTDGILEYFSTLREFLQSQNLANKQDDDMDASIPIIIGIVVVLLTASIIILYCSKKHNVGGKIFSICGLSKNGSLDIVTNEMPRAKKSNDIEEIVEDKV